MEKGSFYREEEEEEEEETESDDDESGVGVEEDESEEEIRDRGKRIMIRLVNGRRNGGGEIESESFGGGGGGESICCQADECSVNLSLAKKYNQRHKVCERHSKAAVVLVAGVRQRFCQQCSRFHEILQFDDNKRSCRKRLAGHNERRRKACSELPAEDEEEPPSMPEMNCATRHHSYSGKHFRPR